MGDYNGEKCRPANYTIINKSNLQHHERVHLCTDHLMMGTQLTT